MWTARYLIAISMLSVQDPFSQSTHLIIPSRLHWSIYHDADKQTRFSRWVKRLYMQTFGLIHTKILVMNTQR
ncbi:hypothetical protein BJY04DRAFT_202687 [Aspergillus karnatakaensis]|uniref:uncharacterized protein n=1 Tax=Aspergillus karnatakaensis TaxID=1810916 RepID=UPI003CCCAEB9